MFDFGRSVAEDDAPPALLVLFVSFADGCMVTELWECCWAMVFLIFLVWILCLVVEVGVLFYIICFC